MTFSSNAQAICFVANAPLLNNVFLPYLLDPEDPRDWAALQRVCKAWNRALQNEIPYYVALQHRLSPTCTWREAFIHYPRPTLAGRMGRAYDQVVARTSALEARVVPAVLSTWISLCLPQNIAPAGVLVSVLPSSLPHPLTGAQQVTYNPHVMAALGLITAVSASTLLLGEEGDRVGDFLLPIGFILLHFAVALPGEDSQLSRAYRAAKGNLAASVPLAKAVCRQLQNLLR